MIKLLKIPQGTEPQTTLCRLCAYRVAESKFAVRQVMDILVREYPAITTWRIWNELEEYTSDICT